MFVYCITEILCKDGTRWFIPFTVDGSAITCRLGIADFCYRIKLQYILPEND